MPIQTTSPSLPLNLSPLVNISLADCYPILYLYTPHLYPSISGHVGCFHILAIINNASMNIGVDRSYWISVLFFFFNIPGVTFLDHMVVLFLLFWGISILFSIMATQIYIPINSSEVFSFLYTLIDTCFLFDDSHSDKCEVILHCGFDLFFPHDLGCWGYFHVPVGHLRVFLGKMSIQIFCPFFNQVAWFF